MNNCNKVLRVLLLLLVSGCTHQQLVQQPVPEHSATSKLIMNKRWLEADVKVMQHPDTTARDITLQFPAHERDDVLILLEDGTYQYDEGATRHHPSHQQVFVKGTWQLDEPKKMLYLTANGSINTYEILEVTDSTLVLKLAITKRTKSYAYTLHFKGASQE
jgi:hypothetical protein